MDEETKTALAGQGYDEVLSDGVLVSPQGQLKRLVAPQNSVLPAVVADGPLGKGGQVWKSDK